MFDKSTVFTNIKFVCVLGDHLAVYPVNSSELVNKLGELLAVDLDTVITLTNTDGKYILTS